MTSLPETTFQQYWKTLCEQRANLLCKKLVRLQQAFIKAQEEWMEMSEVTEHTVDNVWILSALQAERSARFDVMSQAQDDYEELLLLYKRNIRDCIRFESEPERRQAYSRMETMYDLNR